MCILILWKIYVRVAKHYEIYCVSKFCSLHCPDLRALSWWVFVGFFIYLFVFEVSDILTVGKSEKLKISNILIK